MPPPSRLGGFKTMNDVVRISAVYQNSVDLPPWRFIDLISREKINIVYLSYVLDEKAWCLTLAVSSRDEQASCSILKSPRNPSFYHCTGGVILSVFPHRKNPEIPGSLLEIFGRQGIEIEALTNSPSAISLIIDQALVNKASQALFEPFTFSSYRTPADWKLAQKGKEDLYKEVVASYQEKRPKVYGLEYHVEQEFIRVGMTPGFVDKLGWAFRRYAELRLHLTFLSFIPRDENGSGLAAFCLTNRESLSVLEVLEQAGLETGIASMAPVTVFSMNGPHFGDRYGLASEIMKPLQESNICLLGLSCTIASITGVILSRDFEQALDCIRSRFEVPNIVRKN